MSKLTHLNERGEVNMVDVGGKEVTARVARAEGYIHMPLDLMDQLTQLKKGNAFEVARLAGIMGAKRTSELIPLCHNIFIDKVRVDFEPQKQHGRVRVEAEARCHGKTGVEMEALNAVNVALLTLYDMGKAQARDMHLEGIRLIYKSGGKSGTYEV